MPNSLLSQVLSPEVSAEISQEISKRESMMEALKDPSLVPITYTLGPGDIISLDLWGNVNATYEFIVSHDGIIFIPRFESIESKMVGIIL